MATIPKARAARPPAGNCPKGHAASSIELYSGNSRQKLKQGAMPGASHPSWQHSATVLESVEGCSAAEVGVSEEAQFVQGTAAG